MKEYVAWLNQNHEHVYSGNVKNLEESEWIGIYEFLEGSEYNFGDSIEEAEKPLWEKVK